MCCDVVQRYGRGKYSSAGRSSNAMVQQQRPQTDDEVGVSVGGDEVYNSLRKVCDLFTVVTCGQRFARHPRLMNDARAWIVATTSRQIGDEWSVHHGNHTFSVSLVHLQLRQLASRAVCFTPRQFDADHSTGTLCVRTGAWLKIKTRKLLYNLNNALHTMRCKIKTSRLKLAEENFHMQKTTITLQAPKQETFVDAEDKNNRLEQTTSTLPVPTHSLGGNVPGSCHC